MSDSVSHFVIQRSSEKNFGITFTFVFLIFAVLPYFTIGRINYWLLVISIIFGTVTIFIPHILKPLNRLWFKFGLLLGKIVTPIFMIVLYFLVVTPIGLIIRYSGKDQLRLKRNNSLNSYWIIRQMDVKESNSMKNQF